MITRRATNTLNPELTTKLRNAVRENELTFRNWSDVNGWVFAIYRAETFVGIVEVVEATRSMHIAHGSTRGTKADYMALEKLCAAFNQL